MINLPDFAPPSDKVIVKWEVRQTRNAHKSLFAVGRNANREAVSLIILDRILCSEWINGAGLSINNGIDDKLNIKNCSRLKASSKLVIDPKFIYAVLQTFNPRNNLAGVRYGPTEWAPWDPSQV